MALVSDAVSADRHIPAEGEHGLFSRSWFPICQSRDVKPGTIKAFGFMNTRVLVVRSAAGDIRIHSAKCPHLGADLACGDLIDDDIRCAFHHWRFGPDGACAATGIGDPAPRAARLKTYPSIERWGLVFAYHGETPHYTLPDFSFPDEELVFAVRATPEIRADPWVASANTPDWQHIRTLHGVQIDSEDPDKIVSWNDHSFRYTFAGKFWNGEPIEWDVGIYGTSLFFQEGHIDGRWMGVLVPFGLPAPGRTRPYLIIAVRNEGGAEQEHLRAGMAMEREILAQDMLVLNNTQYHQGLVTRSDKLLVRFLEFLRNYPRAMP